MKRRFVTAITLLFLAAFTVLSYLQFHYFQLESLRLIDQQIDRTVSVLASTHLSRDVLSSQEKTEELVYDTLDEEPPNQVVELRRFNGTILYRNELAESLGVELPIAEARTSSDVGGHRIRYLTYRVPTQQVVIQVGLVLDQREISWSHAIWRVLLFGLGVTLVFLLLAAWLTGYLLRPITELARYFGHFALDPSGEAPVPELAAQTGEFRLLSDTIRDLNTRWRRSLLEHSSLTARLVHEIRTPLTVLRNRLEAALSGRGNLENLNREAIAELDHIEALTADFTQWAKIEYSMPSDPSLHAISLVAYVQSLSCVREGPKRLETVFRAPASTKIFARPEHLRLLIENLIQNAERHGDPAKPIILFVEREWFEVRSFGAPVPESVKRELGRPFNRGSEKPGGTGLGLANVASVCRKYGWRFECGREGEENVFRVEFADE